MKNVITVHECRNCHSYFPTDVVWPIQNPSAVIEPGEIAPSGTCPHCQGPCFALESPLPPDPDEQNDDRSDWAELALAAFEKRVRGDRENALSDLLADFGHWCDRNGYSFATELQRAIGNYEDETDGKGRAFRGVVIALSPSAAMPPTRDDLLFEIKRLDHNGYLNLEGNETFQELQHALALIKETSQ